MSRKDTDMFSGRFLFMASLAAGALAYGVAGVRAEGPCLGQCFEKVVTPPSYGVVAEQVMVTPARILAHRTPAQFAVVPNPRTIVPEHVVARYVPAQYAVTTEDVVVAPARKRWVVKREPDGREIGCWEEVAARVVTRQRRVLVKGPATLYHRHPGVVALEPQHIMVHPPEVSRETIPAVYATRHRKVMTSGGVHWRPIGSHPRL
jgi:hypothetical protein